MAAAGLVLVPRSALGQAAGVVPPATLTVYEGDGQLTVTFVGEIPSGRDGDIHVDSLSSAGTATRQTGGTCEAGDDYLLSETHVVSPAVGAVDPTFTAITLCGDGTHEPPETITVEWVSTFGSPFDASAANCSGTAACTTTITIVDDDADSEGRYAVPADWALVPSGVGAGEEFRLLFVSSQRRNAVPADIATYNTWVQSQASGSTLAPVAAFSDAFVAAVGTRATALSVNTAMKAAESDTTFTDGSTSSAKASGTAVWWLQGPKVADSYADFCDGSWANRATSDVRDENGSNSTVGGNVQKWTGSNGTCGFPAAGLAMGETTPIIARLHLSAQGPLNANESSNSASTRRLYGLSPVFVTPPLPVVSVRLPAVEGFTRNPAGQGEFAEDVATITFDISATPTPAADLSLCLSVTETGGDLIASADEGAKTFTYPGAAASTTYTVTWTDIAVDERDSVLTLSVVAPSDSSCSHTGYSVHDTEGSDSAHIEDNDSTVVSLTSSDTQMTEQDASDTAVVSVGLSRRLGAGEVLAVPLSLTTSTGAGLPGDTDPDFTVTASGVGMTPSGLDTASPTLTFTGHDTNTVQTATVTFTPRNRNDGDTAHEAIGVGFIDALLGSTDGATNIGGAAAAHSTNNSVALSMTDDEYTGPGIIASTSTLLVTEGQQGSFNLRLSQAPTDDVTVAITSSDTAVIANPASLTFTTTSTGIWSTDQTVSFTPADEANMHRDRHVTLTVSTTSTDTDWNNQTLGSIDVTVLDAAEVQVYKGVRLGYYDNDGVYVRYPNWWVKDAVPYEDRVGLGVDMLVGATAQPIYYSINLSNRVSDTVTVVATSANAAKAGLALTPDGTPQPSLSITFVRGDPPGGDCGLDDPDGDSWDNDPQTFDVCTRYVYVVRAAGHSGAGDCTNVSHTASGGGVRTTTRSEINELRLHLLDLDNPSDPTSPCLAGHKTATWILRGQRRPSAEIGIDVVPDSGETPTDIADGPQPLFEGEDMVVEIDAGHSIAPDETATLELDLTGATLGTDYTLDLVVEDSPGVTVKEGHPLNKPNPALVFTQGSQMAVIKVTALDDDVFEAETLTIALKKAVYVTDGSRSVTKLHHTLDIALIDTTEPPEPGPSDPPAVFTPDAALVATVTAKADNHPKPDAADRLRRILAGITGDTGGYTATQCRQTAKNHNVWATWKPWCDEIQRRNNWTPPTQQQQQQQQTPAPTPAPTVSVTAGSAVTEGTRAVFTITADPAPAADLTVNVTVSAQGGYGAATGTRTVTIATSGTATLTVATAGDDTDEPDGTVTATLSAGDGYTVSTTNAAATVTVTDDDPAAVFVPDAQLVAAVTAKADNHPNAAAAERLRNIVAGMTGTGGGYTATQCRQTAQDHGVAATWKPWCDEIERREDWTPPTQQQQQQETPAPTPAPAPTVRVTAGPAVTEGSNAVFTITADPAPASDLTVSVTVSAQGDYGAATGTQTVTVATSGTATLTVATTDDDTDEPDGSITATLATGDGYSVSTTQSTATVTVTDNDEPPPTPTVTITAGSGVTEGTAATFTLTASPKPASDLTVNVSVAQSGDYGAATGTRTVTITTSGTATLSVATTDDDTDEPDGSITATLATGGGYRVSSSQDSATVTVADNDDPAPPPASKAITTVTEALAVATAERDRFKTLDTDFEYWMLAHRTDTIIDALNGANNGANHTQNGWYHFNNALTYAATTGDTTAITNLTRLGEFFITHYNLTIDHHNLGLTWPTQ